MLYRVDDRPVLLLCGAVPAYRALHVGVRAPTSASSTATCTLGYDAGDAFTTTTRDEALKALQRSKGVGVTGELATEDAVFLPEAVRIAKVTGQLGGSARPGAPVLSATSDKLHVRVDLDASQQGEVKKGDRAQITLPGNTPVDGPGRPASDGSPRPDSGRQRRRRDHPDVHQPRRPGQGGRARPGPG